MNNTQLVSQLALDSSGAVNPKTAYSEPVAMGDGNAVQITLVIFELTTNTTTAVECQLEQSGDLENWSNKGSASSRTRIGHHELSAISDVNSSYVRVKFTASNGQAVISSNLNVSSQ